MDEMICNKIKKDLGADFSRICVELLSNGIVYEAQFHSLSSMYCKHNSTDMANVFSAEIELDIQHTYDTCYFVYYDTDRYTEEQAKNKLRLYYNF